MHIIRSGKSRKKNNNNNLPSIRPWLRLVIWIKFPPYSTIFFLFFLLLSRRSQFISPYTAAADASPSSSSSLSVSSVRAVTTIARIILYRRRRFIPGFCILFICFVSFFPPVFSVFLYPLSHCFSSMLLLLLSEWYYYIYYIISTRAPTDSAETGYADAAIYFRARDSRRARIGGAWGTGYAHGFSPTRNAGRPPLRAAAAAAVVSPRGVHEISSRTHVERNARAADTILRYYSGGPYFFFSHFFAFFFLVFLPNPCSRKFTSSGRYGIEKRVPR